MSHIRAKAKDLHVLVMALVFTIGVFTPVIGFQSPANAVGTFDNAVIADYAISHYAVGTTGGQCRVFVNNVVSASTGINLAYGAPNQYFKAFEDAGALQIYNVVDLRKGDIVQQGETESDSSLHTYIIIANVSGSTFNVIDSNHNKDNKVDRYDRMVTLSDTKRAYRLGTVSGNVSGGSSSPGKVVPLAGNWSGDARQDFAYVTRRADGGSAIAVQESTAAGLVWKGVWVDAPNIPFDTAAFVPSDFDGDGDLDLFYANPRPIGFDMALLQNTGTSLVYIGQQWNPSNLSLNTTKFLPGNWVGDAKQEFAYVTRRSDGGSAIAIFEATPTGIDWKGVWVDAPNIPFDDGKLVPSDFDGDGDLDLFYANPRPNGFDMALLQNTGSTLAYIGQQWNPSGFSLADTRFLPGNWSGDAKQEFAYITKRSDNGFAFAAFEATVTGIVWKGVWWDQPGTSGVQFGNTVFTAVDMDRGASGNLTDLYYTTAQNWNTPGFGMALQHNGGTSFAWWGGQWAPTNVKLAETKLLPQG